MSRGYYCIGLHQPKTPANVGSALRAAGCFGAAGVFTSGQRFPRHCTDTHADYRRMPLVRVDDLHEVIPFDCVPVAVDLVPGAKSIVDYVHPERAFYVFGPEDGTLGASVLGWCRDVIYIPTRRCLNLAGAVHTVAYDRCAKRGEWP